MGTGGVGQRSVTGVVTPPLSWALPLKILKYMSLGVDVPLFSTRVLKFFLSLVVFLYCLLPLTAAYTRHNGKITISFLLITFYLGSTQSLSLRLYRDMSDPALCQDRVAICTHFSLFFKLAFINTSPQTVDGLLISISHLLSLNEKQFLGQGSFFFFLA